MDKRSRLGSGIFLLLALALALSLEFVNGFHDTANAVATVIYTHNLEAPLRRCVVRLLELDRRFDIHGSGRLWLAGAIAGSKSS